ncbi:MAG: adenine-specific methyltransferase EcoRI family protein [Peptoniphilaceae bacterium]|nr:adenine-specific methyltransferase EcoRI family protein [Peptoniphilaceae bacterium]MDY6086177.1 adenine-specific methyltransferase EcoRI family protein [Peptoniphilaceae bacterium]
MAGNSNLGAAKVQKKDEFYTQYSDIEAEMNAYVEFNPDVFRDKTILLPCDDPEWSNFTKYFAANFERFGLKKLISTSYAKSAGSKQLTLFEQESPLFDVDKHDTHGKLFTLTRDKDGSGHVDTDDIEFSGYLEGDGDFRSAEVKVLRDEADIIITNPPFSLFREFLMWIMEAEKKFIIIGNQNAISYKEVFPLLKDNKIWLGNGFKGNVGFFASPYEDTASSSNHRDGFIRVSGVMWFTNLDLYKRHQPLLLDTMEHNLKFNKKLRKKFETDFGAIEYPRYGNYDAIEVPFVEAIPSDYDGIMGVPRTFLSRYNPEQFEIVGRDGDLDWAVTTGDFFTPPSLEKQQEYKRGNRTWRVQNSYVLKDGVPKTIFARIFIRPKKGGNA